jgi:peptidoglycan/xylan/chitin deacetylase (PgdA/CDA1 family)
MARELRRRAGALLVTILLVGCSDGGETRVAARSLGADASGEDAETLVSLEDARVVDDAIAQPQPDAADAADAALVADTASVLDAPGCGSELPPPGTPRSAPASIEPWEQPADKAAVALTFDDGPDDAGVTDRVLDALALLDVRATFFVNTRTKGDVRSSGLARATIARIVAEGHGLGNHGARHLDLATLSETDADLELSLVEQDLAAALPCVPRPTLVRAPFGSPFLGGTAEQIARVGPIVGRHGVESAWSIDSLDWTCAGKSPSCWLPRVLDRIDAGRRGAILLHSTEPQTLQGLPALVDELRKRGLHFVLVEELVRAKYGVSSAQLTADYRAK